MQNINNSGTDKIMRKKLDKVFSLPTKRKNKVYKAKGRKKQSSSIWQYLYSLFF